MPLIIRMKDSDDVLASGINGDTVVEFEGHWYYAPDSVDMQYLEITDRTYTCPYKGVCYWIDLETPTVKARNIGWVYHNPLPGYELIRDRIAFYARPTAGTIPTHSDGREEMLLPPEMIDTRETP